MIGDPGALLDLTWKLLLVVGLAVLAARLLRWMSNPVPALGGTLQVLARVGLGSQQNLVLVGIGPKRLLLGVTPQQITVLAELTVDDLPVDANGASKVPGASAFARALTRSIDASRNGLPSWIGRAAAGQPRAHSADPAEEKEP
jgi:flagellar biosynthetic protein FliO